MKKTISVLFAVTMLMSMAVAASAQSPKSEAVAIATYSTQLVTPRSMSLYLSEETSVYAKRSTTSQIVGSIGPGWVTVYSYSNGWSEVSGGYVQGKPDDLG